MNISYQTAQGMLTGIRSMFGTGGLKSAEQRQERREKCDRQVAFLEQQKANLKNTECDTLEDIARKLELYHNYEDQIAAAKAAYNQSEAFHVLDEAREQGEKNAEAVKKSEPKTPEERKKDMAKEALGQDQEEGILSELMEELTETVEEMAEAAEALEETACQGEQDISKAQTADLQGTEVSQPEREQVKPAGVLAEEALLGSEEESLLRQSVPLYKRFDARA